MRSRALRRFLEAGPAPQEMGLLCQMLTLARRTRLASPQAAFLLVTSPESAALREATSFRDTRLERGLPFAGYVLNLSWARDDALAMG